MRWVLVALVLALGGCETNQQRAQRVCSTVPNGNAWGECFSRQMDQRQPGGDLSDQACRDVSDFEKRQRCKYDFNQRIEASAREFRRNQSAPNRPAINPTLPATEEREPDRDRAPRTTVCTTFYRMLVCQED